MSLRGGNLKRSWPEVVAIAVQFLPHIGLLLVGRLARGTGVAVQERGVVLPVAELLIL